MDNNDMVYDIVKRVEEKLDRHIDTTSSKVGRAELIAWFTLFAGFIAVVNIA